MNEDKAARYQRLKRRAGVASLACGTALLALLSLSGLSTGIRDTSDALVAAALRGWPSVARIASRSIYLVLVGLLNEAVSLPLAFYTGYMLERRYGLSTESLRRWAQDRLKALALGGAFGLVAFNLVYAAIDRWPEGWWMAAAAGLAVVAILVAFVFPVLLLPIFYRVTPLTEQDLRRRLVDLASRAGVRVVDAYELRFSDRTRKANAALTGLGRTRRILVSDTLLAEYSHEEIETILAHELGHHVHHDLWKGLAVEAMLGLAGFYLASRVLVVLAGAAGLRGPSDIAGLPLLLLTAGALSLLLVPGVNALSRFQERQADRYALETTGNPEAFGSAMRRLASQNLAEPDPSPLVRALFYTHPPVAERIAFAKKWK